MIILLTAPSFGTKHLTGLLFIALFTAIVLYYILKKERNIKIMLLIFSIVFLVLEALKLGYLIWRDGSYPMNHLPLHLCSLPLYVYPILYFSKPGSKLEEYMKAAAYGPVVAAGIIALLMPQNIIGDNNAWFPFTENFLPLLSFVYHGFMITTAIYLVKSGFYKPVFKDSLQAIAVTLCLMIPAMIVNFALDKDFMLLHHGKGSPFTSLLDYGQFVYTSVMIILGFIGSSLPFVVTWLYKIVISLFKNLLGKA